jgi:hypothetical protein
MWNETENRLTHLSYYSDSILVAVPSSETSVHFYQTTRRHIPQDSAFHFENISEQNAGKTIRYEQERSKKRMAKNTQWVAS